MADQIRLTPVYCITCGRPTGNVADVEKFGLLTNEQQTCSDCAGYTPNPGLTTVTLDAQDNLYHCPSCGGRRWTIVEYMKRFPEGNVRVDDGGRKIMVPDDWEVTDSDHSHYDNSHVYCVDCDHQIEVSDVT